MATVSHLDGWNVSVEKITYKEPGGNGVSESKEGFALILVEVRPPTGNKIVFRMPKEVADQVANEIRGVSIFGPGDLPRL